MKTNNISKIYEEKEIILQLEIILTKKSQVEKVGKLAIKLQEFKNLIYLIAIEYFKNMKNLKPFVNKNFLEKFVKGKENLDFENEKIKEFKNKLIKIWKEYLGSDLVNSFLNVIIREYKSIIGLWKKGYKANLPKPRKLKNLHKLTFETNKNLVTDNRLKKKNPENSITIRLGRTAVFGNIKVRILPSINFRPTIKITWFRDCCVIIQIPYKLTYTAEKSDINNSSIRWLAIDLGINNLISAISNVEELRSFIINGKSLKAFNKWYNDLKSKLQSEGKLKELRILEKYRRNRIKQFFHTVASTVTYICVSNNIDTIIIGDSLLSKYQSEKNMFKKNEKDFRYIPLGKLIHILKYKLKIFGIKVETVPELFSSKLSSVSDKIEKFVTKNVINKIKKTKNKDEIIKIISKIKNKIKSAPINGARIKRGLFLDKKINKLFNADINGALNIAFIFFQNEKIRNEFFKLNNWLDKLCRPIKFEIFTKIHLFNKKNFKEKVSAYST